MLSWLLWLWNSFWNQKVRFSNFALLSQGGCFEEEMSTHILSHFKIELFIFLLLSGKKLFLYTECKSFVNYMICACFLPFWGLSSSFSWWCHLQCKTFKLWWSINYLVFLLLPCFCHHSEVTIAYTKDLGGSVVKDPACQCRRCERC